MLHTKEKKPMRISKKVETAVTDLARRDRTSPSAKLDELVRLAIDLDEDATMGALADMRLQGSQKTVSQAKAWK